MTNVRVARYEEYKIAGTSLQGYLTIDHSVMNQLFDAPHHRHASNKCNYHWTLMVTGTFCRIYDQYGPDQPLHIGCKYEYREQVLKDLADYLHQKGVTFKIERS